MKPLSVTVFFIIDGLKLEAQAGFLAASLVRYMSNSVHVIAYHREESPPSPLICDILKKAGIALCSIKGTNVNDANHWSEAWPIGNKILAAREPRESDISVFIDTDIIFQKPINFAGEMGNAPLMAMIADFPLGGIDDDAFIARVYNAFGLPPPLERVQLLSGKRKNCCPLL